VTAIETLSTEHVTLYFVKNRLLDHEIKIKNLGKDTSNKVLQATSLSNNKQKALHLKTKFKAKPSKNFKSNLKCHHCGKKGHFKKDCFIFKRGLENKDKEKHAQVVNVETGRSFAFMLRQGRNYTGDGDISFILDSGASDHMISNINLFSTYSTLGTPIEIAIAKQGAYICKGNSPTPKQSKFEHYTGKCPVLQGCTTKFTVRLEDAGCRLNS